MTRRLLIVTVILAMLLPAGAVWFVLYTEAGARWVLGVARNATGNALEWQRIDGSIADGLTLGRVTFATDGLYIAAEEIAATAAPTLFPPGVMFESVEIQELGLSIDSSSGLPASETDVAAIIESLRLPLLIRVDSLCIANVTIEKDGTSLAELNQVQLELDWDEIIDLRSFTIDGGQALAASGHASLGLNAPFAVAAAVDARARAAGNRLPTPLDMRLKLGGSLELLEVSLSEASLGLDVAGRLTALVEDPGWDLEATLAGFIVDADAGIDIRDVRIGSVGTPAAYQLQAELDVGGFVDTTPIRVAVRASGNGEGLDIASLELDHPAARLGASGRFDFPAAFRGPVEIYELELAQWLGRLDSTHVLTGRVDTAVTSERLSLQNGRFLVAGTDSEIDIDGLVDLGAGSVDARLEWRSLVWPLAPAEPRIQSRDGKAHITGTLDAWQAEVGLAVAAPDIAEGRLEATAAGTRTDASFDITNGEVLGGVIGGSVSLDWANELRWSGEAMVRGLRTAAVLPGYPGILTTHVRVASFADGAGVDVEIVDLRGTVLDENLSGGGRLSLASREVVARNFRLSHGTSRLALDGSLFGESGLAFEFDVPDLALYRPDFSGDLDLNGRLSLRDEAPMLALEGSSRGLYAADLGITSLRVATAENNAGGIDLRLNAAEFAYGARRVEKVDVDASLNPGEQRFAVTMMPLGNEVSIAARGNMSEAGKLSGFPWRGTVEEFTLVTRSGEGGGIDQPVPIELAPDRLWIENFCVSGEARGRLCATLGFDTANGLAVDGAIDGVPIDVLNAFLQTGFDFEQTVSGSISWEDGADDGATGRVTLSFTPGKLTNSRFPSLDLYTGEGELSFEVAAGNLLSGRVALPLNAQGFIDGEFNVDDISEGADSPIRGALNVSTSDIDIFAALLPDIDSATGNLQADLALGGTLGQPLVTGTAAISDGEVNYFPLGLALTDINVDGRFDANRHVELGGTFRAGEGSGEITTRTSGDAGEEPGVHLRIRGKGLKLVELAEISAVADTDLAVDYRNRRLDINGSVDIPRARIRPVNLVTARIDESEDVVVVAGALPNAPDTEEQASPLAVHGKLALGVGKDVQVILDVARATIDGRADFEWSGNPVPTGRGRYNINGTVEAFGQVLNISEGRVSFPGVPATEPLLDIRATREIFGNTQVKRAGVLVQGSILRPTIEAYTYPITTEERALTLLVTGNDFDYEQGVGAIDFGTYIAPRLFLSYGVGVFDRENIVTARYDLTTGFGIRATSGSRESGVDLTYRLER